MQCEFYICSKLSSYILVSADNSTELKNYGAHNSGYDFQTIFNLLYFGLMYILWNNKSCWKQVNMCVKVFCVSIKYFMQLMHIIILVSLPCNPKPQF